MNTQMMLYPLVLQGLLSFIVLGILAKRRLKAIKDGETNVKYFKVFDSTHGGEPESVVSAQRSFLNQFEMPVLFYVVALAAVVFDKVDSYIVYAAWAYVALRIMHAYVHIGSNNVLLRFRIFIFSNIPLLAMWLMLLR